MLFVGLAVLITAIVAVATDNRTWLPLRMPIAAKTALWMSGATTVVAALVVAGPITGAAPTPQAVSNEATITDASGTPEDSTPTDTETPVFVPTAAPTMTPTSKPVQTAASGTALAVLKTIPIKGRAPKTGYCRAQFGRARPGVDGNSCDTRDDILARDPTSRWLGQGDLRHSGGSVYACRDPLQAVRAGPAEATALGNILVQGRAAGLISGSLEALRELVARTHSPRRAPAPKLDLPTG